MNTIELRGGLHVSADALMLANALEAKGHALTVKDGKLLVTNGAALNSEQRAEIKLLRRHLLAVVTYEVPA